MAIKKKPDEKKEVQQKVYLDEKMKLKLDKFAESKGLSPTTAARMILTEFLNKEG